MTKPIYANLTQEQRNTCVAAAIQSGEKLNDWAARILISAAESQLSISALAEYVSHSEAQGYDKVLIPTDKAKWLLLLADRAVK